MKSAERIAVLFVALSVVSTTWADVPPPDDSESAAEGLRDKVPVVYMPADNSQSPPLLLVLPARYRIVQLAFDFTQLRPVRLLTYQKNPKTGNSVLHTWDGEAWVEVAEDDYNTGLRGIMAREVIVIGHGGDVPSALAEQPAWCVAMRRVTTLDLKEIVNAVAEVLKFKPSEWKWLARRYDLELQDMNADRRRYGRYGPPEWKQKGKEKEKVRKEVVQPEPAVVMPEEPVPVKISPPPSAPQEGPVLRPQDK